MKTLALAILSVAVWTSGGLSAANFMVNFRSTNPNAAADVAQPLMLET